MRNTLFTLIVLLVGCVPEPVAMPNPPEVTFPIVVCPGAQDPRLVREVVRDNRWQIPGMLALGCPGTVDVDLEASNERSGGVAFWRSGRPHVELTRVAPCARAWVLRHELGHVAGLADDDRNTAMSDYYNPEDDCANMPSDRFSDRDRAYVRDRIASQR